MPVVATSAYGTVEDVLLAARAIVNDMEVASGDVLTDDAPFTLEFVNLAYRRIQMYLAQYGVETYSTYAWLLNIPANTTGDLESRVIISDSGTEIFTPSGMNEASYDTPFLPTDLVGPLRLRERPNGSSQFAIPMKRPNDGLRYGIAISNYLVQWEWIDDSLQFLGAYQNMDVQLKYEMIMPALTLVTDAVPIRGVDNAAAYQVAYRFSKARGSAIADNFGAEGQLELDYLVNRSMRERQRIKVRRQPYSRSGRGRRYY
jgi:hypothetical protein